MIVKDEEKVIERCLNTVVDIVDEIIIVDTGSQDSTKEKVKRYKADIYDFTWKDDFAEARNFAFSKARMDYILWLDADDVLEKEDQEKLKLLKEYKDTDQNISDLAEENEIKSEDDITYETSNGTYFIDNVFNVADDDTINEMLGEDIKDYFEQDAREMFEDGELYHTDPYKYNGVDPKDFY